MFTRFTSSSSKYALDNVPVIGQYVNTNRGCSCISKKLYDHSLKSDGCKLDAMVSQN